MKNKLLISLIISPLFALCANAQHEGCSHGDAPTTASADASSPFVQVGENALKAINLKVEPVRNAPVEDVITAVGKIENIPTQTSAISSRIAGRAIEVYVAEDATVKKGEPICKIESLLIGNPPPSVVLKSPSDGIVEKLNIFCGSPVSQNEEIARIVDNTKLYAVANVFEINFSKLKIGQIARIKLEAIGGKIFEARLVKFGSKLDSASNTVPVYFEIANPDGKIKSGMRGLFSIVVSENKPALSVSASAIGGDLGNRFVFVEKCPNDRIYERRHVIVGRTNDIDAEILDGLKIGEKVATSGVYQLQFMPAAKDEHEENPAVIKTECEFVKPAAEAEHKHDEAAEANEHDEHANCAHAKSTTDKNANPKTAAHTEAESVKHPEIEGDEHAGHNQAHAEDGHGEESLWERVEESGYFTYLLYSALGVSLFLNILFMLAAVVARKRGKE